MESDSPAAKRWLYESGTHIPLIVRIPKRFSEADQGTPHSMDERLVSSVDFGPTVLNLAESSSQPIFKDKFSWVRIPEPRKYIYGARDRMDERYDIIRAVRGPRYRYVRNFEPLKPYYQYMNTPEKGATMKEIRIAEESDQLTKAGSLFSAKKSQSKNSMISIGIRTKSTTLHRTQNTVKKSMR